MMHMQGQGLSDTTEAEARETMTSNTSRDSDSSYDIVNEFPLVKWSVVFSSLDADSPMLSCKV